MKNNKTVRAERFLERNSNATNSNATAGAEGGVELELYILSDGELESCVGGGIWDTIKEIIILIQ